MMIDTRTRENLEFGISQALREHDKAQFKFNLHRHQIVELALKNEPVPQDLRDEINQAQWNMEYWRESLKEKKEKYIQLIKDIEIPWSLCGEK